MWSEIKLYLELGFQHILDIQGYDHLLFLVAMCALYTIRDWKKVFILATAFTIGHSITLVLAVLDIVAVNKAWVELLIPVTILLMAIFDLLPNRKSGGNTIKYLLAVGFGLIHGLGFSNFLKSLLGSEELLLPLLSFNIGLELGQVSFVLLLLLVAYLLVDKGRLPIKWWSYSLTGLAIVLSLYMISSRIGGVI